MRIKLDTLAKQSGYGSSRIKTRFLILPKKINREIRWLEISSWEQVVDYKLKTKNYSHYKKYFWTDSKWIDDTVEDSEDNY